MLEFIIPHKPTPWAAQSRRKGVWYNPRHAIKVRTQSLIRGQYNGPLIDKICTLFFRVLFGTVDRSISKMDGRIKSDHMQRKPYHD